MVYSASVVSVMIASPSDVVEQRDLVRSAINDWNYVNGFSRQVVLMPVGWETHTAPDLSGRPQQLINDRLLASCDLLVGIFWTKLGTPTGEFESGTVEEITRHIEAGKPAMIYFSDAPVAPQLLDADQYEKVKHFKSWCYERGLVASFSNSEQFRALFGAQLQITLNSNPYIKAVIENQASETMAQTAAPELSADAISLLLAAGADPHGIIISHSTIGGDDIQVNGTSFGELGNAREAARWAAALDELVALKYVVRKGKDICQVTHLGYARADEIN